MMQNRTFPSFSNASISTLLFIINTPFFSMANSASCLKKSDHYLLSQCVSKQVLERTGYSGTPKRELTIGITSDSKDDKLSKNPLTKEETDLIRNSNLMYPKILETWWNLGEFKALKDFHNSNPHPILEVLNLNDEYTLIPCDWFAICCLKRKKHDDLEIKFIKKFKSIGDKFKFPQRNEDLIREVLEESSIRDTLFNYEFPLLAQLLAPINRAQDLIERAKHYFDLSQSIDKYANGMDLNPAEKKLWDAKFAFTFFLSKYCNPSLTKEQYQKIRNIQHPFTDHLSSRKVIFNTTEEIFFLAYVNLLYGNTSPCLDILKHLKDNELSFEQQRLKAFYKFLALYAQDQNITDPFQNFLNDLSVIYKNHEESYNLHEAVYLMRLNYALTYRSSDLFCRDDITEQLKKGYCQTNNENIKIFFENFANNKIKKIIESKTITQEEMKKFVLQLYAYFPFQLEVSHLSEKEHTNTTEDIILKIFREYKNAFYYKVNSNSPLAVKAIGLKGFKLPTKLRGPFLPTFLLKKIQDDVQRLEEQFMQTEKETQDTYKSIKKLEKNKKRRERKKRKAQELRLLSTSSTVDTLSVENSASPNEETAPLMPDEAVVSPPSPIEGTNLKEYQNALEELQRIYGKNHKNPLSLDDPSLPNPNPQEQTKPTIDLLISKYREIISSIPKHIKRVEPYPDNEFTSDHLESLILTTEWFIYNEKWFSYAQLTSIKEKYTRADMFMKNYFNFLTNLISSNHEPYIKAHENADFLETTIEKIKLASHLDPNFDTFKSNIIHLKTHFLNELHKNNDYITQIQNDYLTNMDKLIELNDKIPQAQIPILNDYLKVLIKIEAFKKVERLIIQYSQENRIYYESLRTLMPYLEEYLTQTKNKFKTL